MEVKLYVGNLSHTTSEDDLRALFAQAGTVVWATVITEVDTGISKGFGFVKMTSRADAQRAINLFNAYPLGDRPLTVDLAEPHEERSNRLRLFWASRTAR
jgi:RNA recognition motif-containing protein